MSPFSSLDGTTLSWANPRLWPALVAVAGLTAGGVAALCGEAQFAGWIWAVATLPVLAVLLIQIATSLLHGNVGLDLVAALSMSAGIVFGEPLAAAVVALMYAGGELLEDYADGRARREMTTLLARVPRNALRVANGRIDEVAIAALEVGDVVLVRGGEVLPVDGMVAGGHVALLDESAISGEPIPVLHTAGDAVESGTTNVGDAFHLVVGRPAAESTYARIVQLVRETQGSRAPVQRAADKLAVWFLFLTLGLAALGWGISGDRIRALAVLVTATPCPLILALPVAVISGISRAARVGILVKHGGALEALSGVRTIIFDKTGTLTRGVAEVSEIRTVDGTSQGDLLRFAASLDQASHHVVAEALIQAARSRNLPLVPPESVTEQPGTGIAGRVDGSAVVVGGRDFVLSRAEGDVTPLVHDLLAGTALVFVAIDGHVAGAIALRDSLRPEARGVIAGLRKAGVQRIIMASGDRQEVINTVTSQLGLDLALGNLDPEEKLNLVRRESAKAVTLMVGDGVNDAPALATAQVGMAMAAGGAAASSEAAGIVILVDHLDRVLDAVSIALRTRSIALQSVLGGLGFSLLAMLAAAFGLLSPVPARCRRS